jgi:hypothetical protein
MRSRNPRITNIHLIRVNMGAILERRGSWTGYLYMIQEAEIFSK